MIVKILSSSSVNFWGVKYNDKKINNGNGELMKMNNFPSFINRNSSQEQVRNYLKSISTSKKVKKPQFHAVISTKYQNHSKEELTEIAEEFMKGMGYEKQPYIIVFHNDTDNNHVHIISSRVDKHSGKKINDSFEKLKSQRVLEAIMNRQNEQELRDDKLDKLLKYKVSTINQLKLLLERNGYKVIQENENLKVIKSGVVKKNIDIRKIELTAEKKDRRAKQIKAILSKYKEISSNKVFKVIDDRKDVNPKKDSHDRKIEYISELQQKMKDIMGIDIIFHTSGDKKPFGYTIIDNYSNQVYKGSDIMKMNELFEFSNNSIEKKLFEQLKEYNIRTAKEKEILIKFFQTKSKDIHLEPFMFFTNKKTKERTKIFSDLKKEVMNHLENPTKNSPITIISDPDDDNILYAVHEKYHQVHKIDYLIENSYKVDKTSDLSKSSEKYSSSNESIINDMVKSLMQSKYVGRDKTEDEFKKNKRKNKKRKR